MVKGLKSSHRGKVRQAAKKGGRGGGGNRSLWGELTTQLVYMNYLAISASSGKKSSMICTT